MSKNRSQVAVMVSVALGDSPRGGNQVQQAESRAIPSCVLRRICKCTLFGHGASQVQQAASRAIRVPIACKIVLLFVFIFAVPFFSFLPVAKVSHSSNPYTHNISCEGSIMQIRCPSGFVIGIHYAGFGQDEVLCSNYSTSWRSCVASPTNTTYIVSSMCNGRSDCAVNSTYEMFCDKTDMWNLGFPDKYLEVTHQCLDSRALKAFSDVICEDNSFEVSCPVGSIISVVSAMYGRTNSNLCGTAAVPDSGCESLASTRVVSRLCNGHTSCMVSAENAVFGEPCAGTSKYLNVTYNCLEMVLFHEQSEPHNSYVNSRPYGL